MSASRLFAVLLALALASIFAACAKTEDTSNNTPSATVQGAARSPVRTTPAGTAGPAGVAPGDQATSTSTPAPTPSLAQATQPPATEAPTPVVTAVPLTPKPTPPPTPRPTASPTAPPQPACHPSYVGACLDPNASDYDCLGGSGNGPYYTGPVRVVGPDVFGLDRDGDGYGCE